MQLTARALEVDEKIGGELGDHIMNITVKHALRTRGAEAEKVIMKELSQMIDKRVWRPVTVSSLSSVERSRIIRSQMFLKEKFLPTGEFEKLKARLVAGGNQQDKALYDDLSSPTVSTSAVLSVLPTHEIGGEVQLVTRKFGATQKQKNFAHRNAFLACTDERT